MGILQSEERSISGRTYTIRVLNVAQGRKVYARLQKYLAAWASEDAVGGIGPVMGIGLGGGFDEDDLKFLCDVFGEVTQVDLGDGRVLGLGGKDAAKNQDEVFAGNFEDLFSWLDACVEVSFRGVIEKMKGALLSREAAAPEKKE